jgi:prepilin-type N-terminal cleavage/methylation domain-containing protein
MGIKLTEANRRIQAAYRSVPDMRASTARSRRGFSLIELVIVIVIIGIIAAIAIPRMSRGAEGAAESALIADLAVLRNAIDLYAAEHQGAYPGLGAGGVTFIDQMTKYSDHNGTVSATKTAAAIYGPYLRKMPTLPLGTNKGATGIAAPGNVPPGTGDEDATASVGWLYDAATGQIWANHEDHFDK